MRHLSVRVDLVQAEPPPGCLPHRAEFEATVDADEARAWFRSWLDGTPIDFAGMPFRVTAVEFRDEDA
jgi:hypothetical protein